MSESADNLLKFPRDRFNGELPAVPGDVESAVAIQNFADRLVELTKLGVAPHHFREAIERSPGQAELERAIGKALLRETTAPDISPRLTGREQGIRVSGGPRGIDTKVSCAGAPLLCRKVSITMHGNEDHLAKVEAYLEPPDSMVFHVAKVDGLADIAMAHGFLAVPMMDKELRNVGAWLFGRLAINERRAARMQLVASPRWPKAESLDAFFAGAMESPIAGAQVEISVNAPNEGRISWSLLRAGAMKESGVENCWALLRNEIPLELLRMVAPATGYKLKPLVPKAE